jgi:hypothetical protein
MPIVRKSPIDNHFFIDGQKQYLYICSQSAIFIVAIRFTAPFQHDDTTVEIAYFPYLFGFRRSWVGKRLPKALQATIDLSAGEYNWENADQT